MSALFVGAGFQVLEAALWGELSRIPVEMAALDFDGDQAPDVLLVRGDEAWVRFDSARAESDWISLELNGWSGQFLGGVRVATGDVNGDGFDDIGLAASGANRMLVAFGQSDRTTPPRTQMLQIPGGPTDMDAFDPWSNAAAILSLLALETPEPYVIQTSGATSEVPIAATRFGISIDGYQPHTHLDFVTVGLDGNTPVHTFWLHRAPSTGGTDSVPILTWFGPADSAQGRIHKVSDVTLKRGIISATATWVPGLAPTPAIVLWGPGMSDLTVAMPKANSEVDLIEEEIGFAYKTIKFAVLEDSDIALDVGRLLVTHEDAQMLSIYRWNSRGQLELMGSVSPPLDQIILNASWLGDDGLMVLFGHTAGAGDPIPSGLGFFDATTSGFVMRFETALPRFSPRPRLSRVRVFDRDPFADGQARELESLAAGDWARDAQLVNSTVTVISATFLDSIRGLGPGSLQTLPLASVPPRDAFALANQWEPNSSLFFGSYPSDPGPAAVSVEPSPGSFPGPIELRLSSNEGVTVYSKLGDGPWLEGRGPFSIDRTLQIQFYGVDLANRASPRQIGNYSIGEASLTTDGDLIADTDMDGLDDAWERLLFGGLQADPNQDHDDDGFSTGEEYQAGTDPRNASSVPDGDPNPPLLLDLLFADTESPGLRWLGPAAAQFRVDISLNLSDWMRSTTLPEYRDGAHHWEDTDPLVETRFYRVVRLP